MTTKRTAFGTANDVFHVPISLTESPITKLQDLRMVRYRIIGSLSSHFTHSTHDRGFKHKVSRSDSLIELVGITMGIDQELLDKRVRQVSSWSFSHSLHLNFTHRVVPTYTDKLGRTVQGYTRSLSVESAKQTIQHLLKQIRTESQYLLKQEKEVSKKTLKRYAPVYGVIEFGSENAGIHCHILINCHPSITEAWIQDRFLSEGTVRLHSIGIPVPPTSVRAPRMTERDNAVKYVISRIMQYESIPYGNWGDTYGDITMNEYDTRLVIDTIESHKTPVRYDGRKKGIPKFRPQP